MNALILATEVQDFDPPGDEFSTVAYVMFGAVMLVAAIATWIVTPKGEKH